MYASTAPAPIPVGLLGGMGPAAGLDIARLFLESCRALLQARGLAIQDQAYPEHWLAQVPVADRTRALLDGPDAIVRVETQLAGTLQRFEQLGVRAVGIACNTAHAWHAALQARFPGLEILHIARETARHVQRAGVTEVALLATEGTYRNGLYDAAFTAAGIACHQPEADERTQLMCGIYDGVKADDMALAEQCFTTVGAALRARHGPDTMLIMGCTEIPLALPQAPAAAGWPLVDPTRVLARALAERAYAAG
ncbi:amino acid racemase [uncultured Xylophilus sp.]|uniref:aspartate/glutamate racemase family protein n=1 Tax=uncultured Xylophilus sp. TaxID=296832 RepID=UPI0025FB8355|nr:amino acid racemase [uncultured Xylophilus sp.]